MILAGVSVVLGFTEHTLEHFLMRSIPLAAPAVHAVSVAAEAGVVAAHHAHEMSESMLMILGVSAGLLGIALAWFEYGRKGASRKGFLSYFPAVWKLFDYRWFLDVFYRRGLDTFVYAGITSLFAMNDRRIIDGGIDGICVFTEESGRLFSFLQSGMLQFNLLLMVLVAGAAVLYFVI
jgi:NADH-quinone oxidoreductase subunit L